jgi:hypothetical protein
MLGDPNKLVYQASGSGINIGGIQAMCFMTLLK